MSAYFKLRSCWPRSQICGRHQPPCPVTRPRQVCPACTHWLAAQVQVPALAIGCGFNLFRCKVHCAQMEPSGNSPALHYRLDAQCNLARAATITLPHGVVQTPVFMCATHSCNLSIVCANARSFFQAGRHTGESFPRQAVTLFSPLHLCSFIFPHLHSCLSQYLSRVRLLLTLLVILALFFVSYYYFYIFLSILIIVVFYYCHHYWYYFLFCHYLCLFRAPSNGLTSVVVIANIIIITIVFY